MTFCKDADVRARLLGGIGGRIAASVDRHGRLAIRVINERASCPRPRSILIFGAFPR